MEISYGKGPAKSYMYYQVFGSFYESSKIIKTSKINNWK